MAGYRIWQTLQVIDSPSCSYQREDVNPLVAGSSPARPTKIQRKRQLSRAGVFVLPFRISCCHSATNQRPRLLILGSVNTKTEHRIRHSPGAIMRTLSTLLAATFAAAFVLGSFAITAATPPVRPDRRGR